MVYSADMRSSDEADSAFADLVGSVLSGKYRLTTLVGKGGMGAVYEGLGPDGERAAIKVVRPSADDGATARFLREGKIAARLAHPHLVPVLEVGRDDAHDLPFLVMPFLEGFDLARLLERARPLSPMVAARIAFQACEGLAFAHARDTVHRDVKPSNLFLEKTAEGGIVVRVCDFGIAKMTGASALTQLTNTGAVLGTPQYMAPEAMKSDSTVDPRRDVYGIGAMLYEMLTGAPPWSHLKGGFAALLLTVAKSEPPDLCERASWVDAALAAVVLRALARDPADRPADARELGALLRPFCGPEALLTSDMLVAYEPSTGDPITPEPIIDGDPLVGTKIDGRYRLSRLLGRGGMGAVYEAEDARESDARVAVKVISGEVARKEERSIQRFLREAEAVRSIESPHVVRTFAAGNDRALGSPFLVMELLTGIDLGSHIKHRGGLEPGPTLRVFIQAARGIQAAHDRGVIHRDVKPANLFLHVGADGAITVKVCDFGIAKQVPSEATDAVSHGLTATGGMLGSPRYMSPEQAQDSKRVDRRSDVWSFCISLYETLSGRRAWQECTSLGEVIVAICTRPMRPLREVAPWVDARLAAIVHRGLALEPDRRWQDMSEVAAALTEHLGSESTLVTLEELRPVDRGDHVGDAASQTSGSIDNFDRSNDGELSTQRTIERDRPASSTARSRWLAGLLGAGAAAAGIYMYSTYVVPTREPVAAPLPRPSVAAPETSASAAAPVSHQVLVVSPNDVEVEVDGHHVDSPGGRVDIEGRPGDAFQIVLSLAGARQTSRIFVTSDRKVEPPRLVLEPVAPVAPSARRVPGVSTTTRIGSAPTATASSAAPSAAPSSTAPPIKARENW